MNSAMAEGFPAPLPTPDRPLPPVTRPHAVSEVPPAKKITFYKSGDPQFSGVKMAINRRSFKSFSALMDDLSNRVPLPFGVRTITTPRGTHSINRLDQLQDGGSYICSDKKYVQPIVGRKAGTHRVSRPVSARKPGQQGEPEEEYATTHFQQVPKLRKKIVLVKNGDPTVRRSILLNRRNARNFKTFLEDASDLLQFTVRRIYAMDGKRVENIQAVLQSPSILICAGREAFKPIQSESMRRSIPEKLPGLRSHQHHPNNNSSEIMDNKKNANFGLKAKKSVIHPRSASSNKTRFSLSSEKSYPNGLNMSPANSGFASCPHDKSEDTGHSLVNDDIEKRVHVNKDGSLSVEMKVRFRLLNEETLQWSTQIKKSSTSGKANCEEFCLCDENGKNENAEIYSETDESFYPCDADSYSSKLNDADLEDMYCAHCGMQCQEYDIWKNPMHNNPQEDYVKRATWQTQSSASSTSPHHKLVCEKKTSVDSLHTMSSDEYTEHVLHKSSCYSETRENGETMIRYSTVSQCTSRSGQSSAASNVDVSSGPSRKNTGNNLHRSCASRKSQTSLQSQHSQHSEGQSHLKSQVESFEDCHEASPAPCSGGECCSQSVSALSHSLHSRTSRRSLLKGNSTNFKSCGSSVTCNEDEDKHESSAKATLKNILGMSAESEVSENHCSSECAHLQTTQELNIGDDQDDGLHTASDAPLKSSNSECDKSSTKSSSHSKSSAKRRGKNKCHQNDDQVSCNAPALSSISKQNSEKMLDHQESHETCEAKVADNKSASSKSNRNSFAESRGQSVQSNQSQSLENQEATVANNKSASSKSNRKSFAESRGQSVQSNQSQSLETQDATVDDIKSISSKSNRNSFAESRGQSVQSNQSQNLENCEATVNGIKSTSSKCNRNSFVGSRGQSVQSNQSQCLETCEATVDDIKSTSFKSKRNSFVASRGQSVQSNQSQSLETCEATVDDIKSTSSKSNRNSFVGSRGQSVQSNQSQSLETFEATVDDIKSTSSKSNRKSFVESRGQSVQSNQSQRLISPVAESALTQLQDSNPFPSQEENCKEFSESDHNKESEDCTMAVVDKDDQSSLPISRPSSKSESFSSKCNNVSCPEKNYSISSRVSSESEKKSKHMDSSEIDDQNSSKSSSRDQSQNSEDEKPNDQNTNVETCSRISGSEAHCVHSPSPPKEKPLNRHLRSSHYKYSSASMSSDALKNINEENMGSSRSSTPASKGMMASKTSIETCKMLKNATSYNSTEDIQNTKKRKNSSSSTKRKLKGGSFDSESNIISELIPSALPNVTPEEVVNEWLKKIPSESMVVEYEAEDCQKKVSIEVQTGALNDQRDNSELNEVFTEEQQNNDQAEKEMDECDINNVDKTVDPNLGDKVENNELLLTNNLKTRSENDKAVIGQSICDKKSLPNNLHTTVQIMKALLNPVQESKFDRSNSLPEVSQAMGKKLSNSAKVLISCLASLHLLEDSPKDPTKITNDLNTPKYIELLNIFQALWSEGPASKGITNIKYSREDELTPVSSSGVDINSGFGGSGDGSITGGGDSMITVEKSEDNKLSAVVEEVECTAKNIQHCEQEPAIPEDHNTDNGQSSTTDNVDAGFDEAKPCAVDENMNEKKIGNSFDGDVKNSAIELGNSVSMNITNNEHTEAAEEQSMNIGDTMNILSQSGNERKSNESNSQETNDINSPSDCPSTMISTCDSNGKNDPISNKQTDADPVWVLKLLKKIEKEFMTHYVDAMNEFKVRWNLEDNDNLDEMIMELKNEVSQRIQRSISNELKKIKSRSGIMAPRPPNEGSRRKFSLQAEERRRRLQTMHQRSIRHYIGDENKENGTNDSCETDEEELTFSASFADDSSVQANDDFCPCDRCMKQKRALKLANPKPVVADAPIIKAFDLQQILKMKRENIEPNNDGTIIPPKQECDKDVELATEEDGVNNNNPIEASIVASEAAGKAMMAKSDVLDQDGQDYESDIQEDRSVSEEKEVPRTNDLQCEAMQEEDEMEKKDSEVENKSPEDLNDEVENANSEELEKSSIDGQGKEISSIDGQGKEINTESSQNDSDAALNEEEKQNTSKLCPEDQNEEPLREVTSEHEEPAEAATTDDCPENGDTCEKNETVNPVINTVEDSEEEDTEVVEHHGPCFQKSCLGQASLITQNGSAEETEEEHIETSNTEGETSPNGQSNSSGSKNSQMYPESTSEEEDSPRASPVGTIKSERNRREQENKKGSFEDSESDSKKALEGDAIDEDEFDF